MKDDNDLRRLLHAAYGSAPPGIELRPRLHVSEPKRRISRRLGAGLAVSGLTLAVALPLALSLALRPSRGPVTGADHPSPVSEVSPSPLAVVPWLNLQPPAATPTSSPTEPACGLSDVRASSLTLSGVAAGSQGYQGTLTLVGSKACTLLAGPMLAVLHAADGQQVRVSSGGYVVLTPAAPSASMTLMVGGYCSAPAFTQLTMTLSGGELLVVDIKGSSAGQGCADMSPTYALMVSSTAPRATPSPSPSPSTGLAVAVRLAGPAKAGSVYDYDVVLTNHAPVEVTFQGDCPAYSEGLKGVIGVSEPAVAYRLNCQAATSIAPGGSETFAMELTVPSFVTPGTYLLTWDIANGQGGQASLVVG